MGAFKEFLSRNSVQAAGVLPLVHTRPAYFLKKILGSNAIETEECDVYVSEKLNYFFVGRPSYKYQSGGSHAEIWEFPVCFIFDFETTDDIRRIFPFDTGAFSGGRYPKYIQMMPREEFEVTNVPDAPSKLIGAFFGSPLNYLKFRPKSEETFIKEYSLSVFDAELKALHRLASEKSHMSFDDRRFAIEIQNGSAIDLKVKSPLPR